MKFQKASMNGSEVMLCAEKRNAQMNVRTDKQKKKKKKMLFSCWDNKELSHYEHRHLSRNYFGPIMSLAASSENATYRKYNVLSMFWRACAFA